MLHLLLTIAGVHLVAVASPGPDFFFVSQTAVSQSRSNALCGVAGIALGVAVWAGLSLFGLQVLFEQFPWMQQFIMTAGGLYLLWMGWNLLKAAFRTPASDGTASIELKNSALKTFTLGLFTNLANAKAIIYFSSIFSMFVSPDITLADQLTLFTLVCAETFLWFALVVFIFSQPAIRSFYQRKSNWINGITGVIFALFGIALIAEAFLLK